MQRLFVALAPDLDTKVYRPVNQRYWALKVGIVQQTVSTAINTLCRDGVLERGTPDGNEFTYRINVKHPLLLER